VSAAEFVAAGPAARRPEVEFIELHTFPSADVAGREVAGAVIDFDRYFGYNGTLGAGWEAVFLEDGEEDGTRARFGAYGDLIVSSGSGR
jgi:hypothetical protein